MKAIDKLKSSLEGDVFGEAEATLILGEGNSRYSAIKRLLKSKDIIRLSRGHYLLGPQHRRAQVAPLVIANTLYGPSYVSLQSMLSFYGLIPEAVVETTSVNTKKTKIYTTPIGRFSYRIISASAFSNGVCAIKISDSYFIGATKPKAILDMLYLSKAKNALDFLTQSLRVETENLKDLDASNLKELAKSYTNKAFEQRINDMIEELNLS